MLDNNIYFFINTGSIAPTILLGNLFSMKLTKHLEVFLDGTRSRKGMLCLQLSKKITVKFVNIQELLELLEEPVLLELKCLKCQGSCI